jgi:serine/threonine protein kinase
MTEQRLQWCIEAAEGVVLLHSLGIIHADIKPENMLLVSRPQATPVVVQGHSTPWDNSNRIGRPEYKNLKLKEEEEKWCSKSCSYKPG